jgi:hypothetical protein
MDKKSTTAAARDNNLDMLKFLVDSGCSCDNTVIMYAVEHNNLEMFKCAEPKLKCRLNSYICEYIVKHGYLDMLKYAL